MQTYNTSDSAVDRVAAIIFLVATAAMVIFTYQCFKVGGLQFIKDVQWVFDQANIFLLFIGPVLFLATVLLVYSLPKMPRKFLWRYLLAILPIYGVLFAGMWAICKRHSGGLSQGAFVQQDMMLVFAVLSFNLGLAIALTSFYKGHRFFFSSLFGLIFSYTFAVYSVMYLSLAGIL